MLTIPLYMFDDSHLVEWIGRCKAVMADSDSGAPELAVVIQTMQAELFNRLGTNYRLEGDQIIAEQVKQTAN